MLLDFSVYTPLYVSLTWALILLISSGANKARFFLGIFMFMVTLLFLSHAIYYQHLKEIYLYFDLVFIFSSLSIYPIYYWYIKLLTFKSGIVFKDLAMLAPAVVMLGATIITYLFMSKQLREMYVSDYLYGDGKINGAPALIKIQLILSYILQIIYFLQIIFSFLKIRIYIAQYNNNIENFYSNLENKTIEWHKIILNSFVLISVVTIFTNFFGRSFFDKYPVLLLLAGLSFSVLLFVFGYLGYMQNHTIVTFEQDTLHSSVNEAININHKKINLRLLKLFEKEQVFKNADLKITDVASRLNTNRTYISSFINSEYNCSFSTFVNQYRVEEAKKVLLDEENNNFSLEHISTLAGFGSLHSFIRVFKDVTGTTPGRYRETSITPPIE